MATQGLPAGGFVLGSDNIQPGTTYSFLATLSYTGESPFTLISATSTINTPAASSPVLGGAGSSQTIPPVSSSATPQSRRTSPSSRPLRTTAPSQSRPTSSSLRPSPSASSNAASGISLSFPSSSLSSPISSSSSSSSPSPEPQSSVGSISDVNSSLSQSSTSSAPSASSSAGPPLAAGASSTSSSGTSKGVIVGAVVGSVLGFLLLLLLLFLFLFLLRRRRRNRSISKDQIFHAKPHDTFYTSAATSEPGTAGGAGTAKSGLSEKGHASPFGDSPYTERSANSDNAPAVPAIGDLGSSNVAHQDFGHPRGVDLGIGAAGLAAAGAGVGIAATSNKSRQDYHPDSFETYEQPPVGVAGGPVQRERQAQPPSVTSAASTSNTRQGTSGGLFGHRRSRNSESTEASSNRGSTRGIWPFSSSRGDTRPSTATKSIVDEDPPVLPDIEPTGGINPLFGSVATRNKATSPEPLLRDSSLAGTVASIPENTRSDSVNKSHPTLEPGTIPTSTIAAGSEEIGSAQAAANAPSPQEEHAVLLDPSDPSYFSMQAPPEPKPRSPLRLQKQFSGGIASQSNSASNSRPITPANQVQGEGLAGKPGTTPPLQTFLTGSSPKRSAREPGPTSEQQSPVSPTRSYQGHTREQSNATSGSLEDSMETAEVGTAVPMPVPSRNTRRISRPYVRPTTKEAGDFDFQFEDIRAGPYAAQSEPNTAYQTARHSQEYLPHSRDDNEGQRYYERQSGMARGPLRNSRATKHRGSWFVEEDDDEDAGNNRRL